MKILVFGGTGNIGRTISWELTKVDNVELIGIVGRNLDKLIQVETWINSPKAIPYKINIEDKKLLKNIMSFFDVGIIALPDRKTSYQVAETAIEAGLNIVDILEEYHRSPDLYETEGIETYDNMSLKEYGEWLHKKAIENNVTFIDGMGFAPGLSNITIGNAISQMDKAEDAIARVGGIPSKTDSSNHPLKYMITWAFEHVLREYMVKVNVIKNGKITEVEAMSDYETFNFNELGLEEKLECFVTPGMPSFLHTRPALKNFAEKTIRWPGHYNGIQTLKECGLLSLEPVNYNKDSIIPRNFLFSLIKPKLQPKESETDVCVMYNTVDGITNGKKHTIEYYMWDSADKQNKISSMARVTGFSAAIAALMIGNKEITKKGILAPEDCITGKIYEKFISELKKRNINIVEINKGDPKKKVNYIKAI